MSKLDERLKNLGFLPIYTGSEIPKLFLYERKLSSITSLFIEGRTERNNATYVYDFYKCSFYVKSSATFVRASNVRYYGKSLLPRLLISKVANYIGRFNLDEGR